MNNPYEILLCENNKLNGENEFLKEQFRQLKRALWLARAMRACTESAWWDSEASDAYDVGNVNKMERCDKKHELWHNVYLKCKAMADKYK